MTSTTRTPGALTVGTLRPVILKLAAPAVAMMACHFCFNLIDSMWVGRLIGPAALAAVSTAGFYVWVLLSLGEMVEVGLIAVAARRHGEGFPDAAARAAGAAVQYALVAGTVVSVAGLLIADWLFRAMGVPADVPRLGRHPHPVPLARGVGAAVRRARPAAHRGRGSLPAARRPGRGGDVGDGAGWGVSDRDRHRAQARADPARYARLARRAHDLPCRGAAVARRGAAVGDLHVAHPVHLAIRHAGARRAGRGPQGGRARVHRHLRVRALGERARRPEPGRAPGGPRSPGRADDRRVLPARHHHDGARVPHGPADPRLALYVRSGGDPGRQPLPPGDRFRADRADVRDHPRGRARRRGLHPVAAGHEHLAHAVADTVRRLVVARDRRAGYLARALGHG